MKWHDLLFMHWPVPAQTLRPLVPPGLELDTYEGAAWIGIVPFSMSGIRARFLPRVPGVSAFHELNVRTYVTSGGHRGVWFFSLDATSRVAVRVARATFHLPYFVARYRPNGPIRPAGEGTLESFLTRRLCLYSADSRGAIYRGDILHAPSPLQSAEAEIEINTMTDPLKIALPTTQPLLHFSKRLDVVAWKLQRV